MKTYNQFVECESRGCNNEQKIQIELPDNYTDDDVRKAVDDTMVECDDCGDIAWSVSFGNPTPTPATV